MLRRSLGAACAAILILVACEPQADPTFHEEDGYRWREWPVPRRGARASALRGDAIGSRTATTSMTSGRLQPLTLLGAGVAIGDIDSDGLPDVFLTSVEAPAALYRKHGDMRFADVDGSSGIDTRGLATRSATFADVDGRSRLDSSWNTRRPAQAVARRWRRPLSRCTAQSGLVGGYAVTALTLADVTATVDLTVCRTYKPAMHWTCTHRARDVRQVVRKVGNTYTVVDQWASEYRIADRPDLGGVIGPRARSRPVLSERRGRSVVRTTIGALRLLTKVANHWRPSRIIHARGPVIRRECDGAPDLYVCNDFEIRTSSGERRQRQLRLAPLLALRETSNTCMAATSPT